MNAVEKQMTLVYIFKNHFFQDKIEKNVQFLALKIVKFVDVFKRTTEPIVVFLLDGTSAIDVWIMRFQGH